MLFRQESLDGIRDGRIRLAFRRWRRPSVRPGGTLLTAIGQLSIDAVVPVTAAQITAADARLAGYESLDALLSDLDRRTEGELYRIEIGGLRPDPRIALRESAADVASESGEILRRLGRLDAGAQGPWTRRVLEMIQAHPGVRAGDLCQQMGQPRDEFKINVRKLKALGLTESLEVGYRLSPRGAALLEHLHAASRLVR